MLAPSTAQGKEEPPGTGMRSRTATGRWPRASQRHNSWAAGAVNRDLETMAVTPPIARIGADARIERLILFQE